MRIGYDAMLLGPEAYGVSRCIARLGEALVRDGAELVVYARPGAPVPSGAALHRAPAWTEPRGLRIAWEQLALPKRARADGIDLLHAPGYLAPVRSPVPVVLNTWDLFALTHPEFCTRANRACYRLLLPGSIRRAARVIVPAHAVRAELLERFDLPEERVVVIPPGIEPQFFEEHDPVRLAELRERLGLERPFVLFAANPEPKKNLERLVEAFELAVSRGELDGELVLTGGDGWGLAPEVLRGRTGVRRIGYVPDHELPLLFGLARVLALPSLVEGWGLPVSEAMASGLPVLCSGVPALEDTDPRAALVVEPTSVEEMAAGLARLWSDEDLRARQIELGRAAAAQLSWERVATRTRAVHEEALAG